MESGYVTTPFGRRSMSLGMLASQMTHREIDREQTIDKWKLFRSACFARPLLGVSDRALAVLNALLSFYPKNELSEANGLVVFPSNAQLSFRCHGMAEATLRRHLAALVDADLIIRKDSPNGKRYARKDGQGAIDSAFGFSLAPLLCRAQEIEALGDRIEAEQMHLRRLREQVTLCRRDIAKLIETALSEGVAGDWEALQLEFRGAVSHIQRKATAAELQTALDALTALRDRAVKQLETKINSKKSSGNALQNERHIQNSNTQHPIESEPAPEKSKAEMPNVIGTRLQAAHGAPIEVRNSDDRPVSEIKPTPNGVSPPGHLPLSLVLQSCPEIGMFGKGGRIENWRDLMSAAVVVRSMLGISPSAYEAACDAMGPENAATAIACILERGGLINSAGGYLRDLTRRCERGEFTIGPMVMALLRANAPAKARAG